MGLSLLENRQDVSKGIVGPHQVNISSKNLDERSDRDTVFWIQKNEILHEEQPDDVVSGDFKDRDTRIPSLENLSDGFKTESFVDFQHEGLLHGRHGVLDRNIFVG